MAQKKPYVVFLDLDKTLLTINSGKILVWQSYKKNYLSTLSLIKALVLAASHKLGLLNSLEATELMSSWLKGVPEASLKEMAQVIVTEKLIYKLRPSIIKEIEHHRNKGAQLVILSAALPYICKPLANHLKLDDIICSNMEVKHGFFTGKPIGNICIEKEKEVQIRKYCLNNLYKMQEAYYYGDSYSDRFALAVVGFPVCVDADKQLLKLSISNKWPLMQ